MANTKSDYTTLKRSLPQPDSGQVMEIPVVLTLGAAPVLNDTIELVELPPGVDVIDFEVIAPQIDSNATPLLTATLGHLNAGKTDLAVAYSDAMTIGRTANGNVVRNTDARASQVDNTNARIVALKWTAAAATWAGLGKSMIVVLHLKG